MNEPSQPPHGFFPSHFLCPWWFFAGLALGLGLISQTGPVRGFSWLVTQFFRNAPWLVLLFYCILLMPFEVNIGGVIVPLPGWMKSTFR